MLTAPWQRFHALHGVLILAAALLSGCESVPLVQPRDALELERAHQQHLQWLSGIEHWQARGRFAARVREDALSASMSWKQDAQHFDLRLSGPFGQGVLRIEGGPGAVRMRTSDGREALAPTPEELLSRELGWQVPVSILRYWILGRPAPDIELQQLELDDQGRVLRMFQAGWDVRFVDYLAVDGGMLPRKVEVRGPAVELTLLMTDWTAS